MITKEYTPTRRSCRVTFALPPGTEARTAALVGDFNDWDNTGNPMKRQRDGSFRATVSLKPGRRYAFRYLLDGEHWENDPAADDYAPNPFGSADSIIEV